MKLGIAIFPADFGIQPDELARTVEERDLQDIDTEEIIATVRARGTPMMSATAGLQL